MVSSLKKIIKIALQEDLNQAGDITSHACIDPARQSRAKVISRQKGVIAGTEAFKAVFQTIDSEVEVNIGKTDGTKVAPNEVVAIVEGRTRSLLSGERTALNFLGHLSGIATKTASLVEKIAGTKAVLLDTRKTLPGLRELEKSAVRAGGGANHRFGLFDMILIKENHIASVGGIIPALKRAQEFNLKAGTKFQIEIEVRNLEELAQALSLNPHRIMLDNFTPEKVAQAVLLTAGRVPVEVSGGVNEENIRSFAQAGPDFISVGSLTASASTLDLSMLMEE
jgi:nicotinate-nucleotide pyrophosphorylase (carboxylating)